MTMEKINELRALDETTYANYTAAQRVWRTASQGFKAACRQYLAEQQEFKQGDMCCDKYGAQYFYVGIDAVFSYKDEELSVSSHLVYKIKKNGERYANTTTIYGKLTKVKGD